MGGVTDRRTDRLSAAEREPFPETVMGVVNLGLVKE